jgi:hypothetical protein
VGAPPVGLGHVGAGGVWTPLQAEAVVITSTGESYAILESVETIKERMADVPEGSDHLFIHVTPKEGGTALLNVKHIVGFVSQGGEAQA